MIIDLTARHSYIQHNNATIQCIFRDRGVGRWFGKGGLYRSIGKGSMISVYKIEPSYVTIRKHRGAPAPGAPMVPMPMREQSGILNSNFNMRWMVLAQLFNSISVIISVIGAFEFICSQSPYSMRGLLFGATYCCVMLYSLVGYGIMKPFTKLSTSISWGAGIISCEFWYLLLLLVILILNSIMVCILSKWYKNRKREDVLPNEQVFAERYYTY